MRGWRFIGEVLLLALSVANTAALGAEHPVGFNRDIRPLLSDRCFVCHGPGTQEAGLRLDSFAAATESAIVPGDIDASEVIADHFRRFRCADAAAGLAEETAHSRAG